MKNKGMLIGGLCYILASLYVFVQLYFGEARFLTTIVVYSWGVGLLFWLYTQYANRKHWFFSGLVLLGSLFIAEIVLRYGLQRHVTYSELNSGRYVSSYGYHRMVNFQLLTLDGRKNAHTNEFKPNQKRNYSGDSKNLPDEFCNALGTRGVLPSAKRKVVYVMGDSFAEGVGTPADSTFAVLLEQQYRKIDTNYSLLNLGVAGFDIFLDWNFLQKQYQLYLPKEVIILINTTDIGEVMTRGGKDRFLPDGRVKYVNGPWWEPLYAVSFIYRLVMQSLFQLDWQLLNPEQSTLRKEKAINGIAELINKDIADWAEVNQVKVKIVLHPLQHEAVSASEEYIKLLSKLKTTQWIEICDLQPAIYQNYGQQALYWPTDQHFLPLGYAILAKLAADSCTSISHRN